MNAPTVPYFYKYRTCDSMERLEQILSEHRVYFPTADTLNDPMDCRPKVIASSRGDFARHLLHQWVRANPHAGQEETEERFRYILDGIEAMGDDEFYEDLVRGLHGVTTSYRVFSMSKRWDNLAQWAKYSADHSGCCLEFANAGIFAKAREVTYGATLELDMTSSTAVADNIAILFRKTPEWSGEEEVRIVVPKWIAPHQSFEPELLTSVTLGMKIPQQNEQQIRRWAAARTPPLTVLKASYDTIRSVMRRA